MVLKLPSGDYTDYKTVITKTYIQKDNPNALAGNSIHNPREISEHKAHRESVQLTSSKRFPFLCKDGWKSEQNEPRREEY